MAVGPVDQVPVGFMDPSGLHGWRRGLVEIQLCMLLRLDVLSLLIA